MTESNELLPCPFCGNAAVAVRKDYRADMAWIACPNCGLESPTETGVSIDAAISYWNNRLTHPEAQGNKDLGEPAASGLEEEAQLAAVKFANMILDAYWPDCNDIEGADIQSFGIKSGVMQEVPGGYDPEKHGESVYDAEPGDTWYVAHPGLLLLLQAQRVAKRLLPLPNP